MYHVLLTNTEETLFADGAVVVIDIDVRMLHDHLLQSDSGVASFAAQYHQHHAPLRILSHHQFDGDPFLNHVGHVAWTGPRYDIVTPQCVYNQRPTSSSIRARGQTDVATFTPVSAAKWPYAGGHLQPTTHWTSPLPAAVAASTFWGCTTHSLPDDRVFTYTTTPQSSSAAQFGADDIVPCWRFDGGGRSAETTTNFTSTNSTSTPIHSELEVLATSNNEPRHQLTHISTLSHNYPPCSVSTSSEFSTRLSNDDTNHQFGTRPTRASTSIGVYAPCTYDILLTGT